MKNLEVIQELIEAKQQLQRVLETDNPSIIAMRTRQSIKHIDQAAWLLDTKTLKSQDPIVGSKSPINTIVDEVNRTIKDQLLELIGEEKKINYTELASFHLNTCNGNWEYAFKSFVQALELKNTGVKEKSQDPVVESVVSKLRSRSSVGIEKYGKTLADNDLSFLEWVKHSQEEQMDNVNYLETILQNGVTRQKKYIERISAIHGICKEHIDATSLALFELEKEMKKDLENLGVKFDDRDL